LDLFFVADLKGADVRVHPRRVLADERQGEFCLPGRGPVPLGINLAVIEYTLAPAARLDRIAPPSSPNYAGSRLIITALSLPE
jgi:hypothetical protein